MAYGLNQQTTHCKKVIATCPSPDKMSLMEWMMNETSLKSLTEFSLGGNRDSLVTSRLVDENVTNLFFGTEYLYNTKNSLFSQKLEIV